MLILTPARALLSLPLSRPTRHVISSDQVDGFRVSFDVHGLEQFEAAPETQHLAAFFKRARLSEANAWSMSVYSVRPATGAADALSLKLRQMTSGLLDLPQPHVAHHLDLLWLRVPDDCSGGHLQIWNHKRGDPLSSAVVLDAPDTVCVSTRPVKAHPLKATVTISPLTRAVCRCAGQGLSISISISISVPIFSRWSLHLHLHLDRHLHHMSFSYGLGFRL